METYCFTSLRSFVRPISFVSVRSLRLSSRRSNTRRWPNAELLLAHSLRRWANISPVLFNPVLFDATQNVGKRHSRRANINPALVQSIVPVVQPAWSRPTDYSWMDTGKHWRRRRWARIGPALGQRFLFAGSVSHITGCGDIKTVAQLIVPKDDLVTVDHLPASKRSLRSD